jgi:hypothetical protein
MASEAKRLRRALDVLTGADGPPASAGFPAPSAAPDGQLFLASLEARDAARPWTEDPNIQGLGMADRITAGRRESELALKVYVERKLPMSRVENPVPAELEIPGVDGRLATDVEEIGRVELEAATGRFRPAMPGCGLGHPEIDVGTFGCLVRKRFDPECGPESPASEEARDESLYVLSNSHVLANHGVCRVGDLVVQAGRHDGGLAPDDALCELAEWVPFEFTDTGFPNRVDAAIARVLNPEEVTSAVRLIGVPPGHTRHVQRDMEVHKCGRSSDLTWGKVRDVDYRLQMSYKRPEGGHGRVGLRDQVLCTRYTAPGDSGSAVFSSGGLVVGLHFAGSSSTSIFNRIGHVLDALDLELVTEAI